jgi:hypothetical protein
MNTITIERRNVYGVEKFYPVDETAQRFAQLTGTKTLCRKDLFVIKALGFKIEVKQQELSL